MTRSGDFLPFELLIEAYFLAKRVTVDFHSGKFKKFAEFDKVITYYLSTFGYFFLKLGDF